MKKHILSILYFVPLIAFSQGIVNNGASIVFSGISPQIYIDGGANGNYLSQANGTIVELCPLATPGTMTLSGNWINNAGNIGFTNYGTTVNFNGANQSIGGSSFTHFTNVNLLGSGNKTLNIQTRVGGLNTGILSLGSRPLILNGYDLWVFNPNPGGITYTTGYIESETNAAVNPSFVKWFMGTTTGAHIYPFGVAGTQIPFTFNKTTVGSATIDVSTRATAGSNNVPWAGASNVAAVAGMQAMGPPFYADASIPSVIDRWWDITASAAVTANLIFSYRGIENTTTAAPLGTFGAQHWDGSQWEPPVGSGAGVTAGVGTVSVTGASTFSPWVLSSSILPLPIELIGFTGECSNNKVVLKWATASEVNNNYFTIEKSNDGIVYYEIATINGAGNSTHTINYSYTDNAQNTGVVYYRLKQTDYNGACKTFKTISVAPCENLSGTVVNAYSNNYGGVVVLIDEKNATNYNLKIFDAVGKLIKNESIYAQIGSNSSIMDVSSLSSGVYFISVESASTRYTQKFIVR